MTIDKYEALMKKRDKYVEILKIAKLSGDGKAVTNARRNFTRTMNQLRPYLLKYLNYNKPAK